MNVAQSIQEMPDNKALDAASQRVVSVCLNKVSYSYNPGLSVISHASLELTGGEFALLTGANGSGKSTLLRLIAGVSAPDEGSVVYSGFEAKGGILRQIGYLGHHLQLYLSLTVFENIALVATLMGLKIDQSALLERWELSPYRNSLVGELSRGVQVRIALCRTLMHNPVAIFLDEPTATLDEKSFRILMKELQKHGDTSKARPLLLIATHDFSRLSNLANRIIVLDQGRIACDSKQLLDSNKYTIADDAQAAALYYYRRLNR